MIDPGELRAWLIEQMADEPTDASEEATRDVARARIDAYVRVGERFGVLSANDGDVKPLLPPWG